MKDTIKGLLFIVICCYLGLPGIALSKELNDAQEPAVKGPGAVDLLEGNVKAAWQLPSNHWQIDSTGIVGKTGEKKLTIPEWIYTQQRFGDFEFTCELKLTGDTRRNTGIYYRVNTFRFESKRGKKSFEAPSGYEFDAAFHSTGKRNYWGSLGDWYARPSLRIYPDKTIIDQTYQTEAWNRMTIRARGNRLEYWINGIKVMDYLDHDPKASREGVIGVQIHDGSVMQIECRNIRVRPL